MIRVLSTRVLKSITNEFRLFQNRVFAQTRGHSRFNLIPSKHGISKVLQQDLCRITAVSSVIKRHKSSRNSRSSSRLDEDEDEEDDDDYEDGIDDDEDDHFRTTFPGDKSLPRNYKERKAHLSSLRVDTILSAGLNMSRRKVEDFFLGSRIKLNGDRVLKKSAKVDEGDCIDMTESNDGTQKTKRVRIVKVLKNDSGKFVAYLRSWKGGIESP